MRLGLVEVKVVGDAHLNGYELPEHEQRWQEVDPNQQKVLVEDVEHRVEAMCHRKLLSVSSDAVKQVWIHVDVTDVEPGLVFVDVVYFLLVKYCFKTFQNYCKIDNI